MVNDYAIEVHGLQKLDKDNNVSKHLFCISFDYRWVEVSDERKITTCCIIELPSKKIYSGATIRNNHDMPNEWIARRWAYKRAVLNLYMIWNLQGKTDLEYKPFWQLFRMALAENKIYLSERKVDKNG
jgi:hypothetical protein